MGKNGENGEIGKEAWGEMGRGVKAGEYDGKRGRQFLFMDSTNHLLWGEMGRNGEDESGEKWGGG